MTGAGWGHGILKDRGSVTRMVSYTAKPGMGHDPQVLPLRSTMPVLFVLPDSELPSQAYYHQLSAGPGSAARTGTSDCNRDCRRQD